MTSNAEAERDRAERDNRAKDEFIAMLAHEVRNPARSDRWCCPEPADLERVRAHIRSHTVYDWAAGVLRAERDGRQRMTE